jgi:cysteine-S-conjugate beta-lyase
MRTSTQKRTAVFAALPMNRFASNPAPPRFRSFAPTVWRASTVLFDSLDDFVNRKSRLPDGFSYGTTGTPTQRALEARIAQLDSASHAIVFPSGQAAICMAMLVYLRAGDRLLIPESIYPTARSFAQSHLSALGIEVVTYDATSIDDLRERATRNTRLIWLESPGSISMEIQDIPAITEFARSRGIATALDNTWASPLGFAALANGVDLCIHACTKYFGGHSDLLMGSISTNDSNIYGKLRGLQATMGQAVSPEDCALLSRGMDTFELRWLEQSSSAVHIADCLRALPQVDDVLHPAVNGAPGHAIWRRDFSGSGSVFSLRLRSTSLDVYEKIFSRFSVFSIGASWGGVHSVAAFYPHSEFNHRVQQRVEGSLIRLSIGLESTETLLSDLICAFDALIPTSHCSTSRALA